jgi:hypothetical protein
LIAAATSVPVDDGTVTASTFGTPLEVSETSCAGDDPALVSDADPLSSPDELPATVVRLRGFRVVDEALSSLDAALSFLTAPLPLRRFPPGVLVPSAGLMADGPDAADAEDAPWDDSVESAAAVPHPRVTAAPIPSATARPPTRPTYPAAFMLVSFALCAGADASTLAAA